MAKLIGSFVQFPGVIVTLLVLIYFLKRKSVYLILAAFVYFITIQITWLPIQRIWTLSEKPKRLDTVVLGGGIIETPGGYEPTRSTLARLKKGFEIWKEMKGKIYLSGGGYKDVSEAEVMKEILIDWGVPENDIITEGRSMNTKENALFLSKELPSEFNLVTSALHMRRAVMSFEAVGKKPNPVPADFLLDDSVDFFSFLPDERALDFISELSHEIIGIVYYKLGGM